MCSKINVLFPQFLKKLLAQTRKLHTNSLHTIAELRRNSLHDSNCPILK
uniref:FtsH2B n=1 Tax=Arundo donax TaxID=35708 RepID=A0A0A9E125_ARUDO